MIDDDPIVSGISKATLQNMQSGLRLKAMPRGSAMSSAASIFTASLVAQTTAKPLIKCKPVIRRKSDIPPPPEPVTVYTKPSRPDSDRAAKLSTKDRKVKNNKRKATKKARKKNRRRK